jgi:hypothetical protein
MMTYINANDCIAFKTCQISKKPTGLKSKKEPCCISTVLFYYSPKKL